MKIPTLRFWASRPGVAIASFSSLENPPNVGTAVVNMTKPPTKPQFVQATPAPLVVVPYAEDEREAARDFAADFSLPLVGEIPDASLGLRVGREIVALQEGGKGRIGPVSVDLVGGALGRQRKEAGFRKQTLFRALGAPLSKTGVPIHVMDATAGFGRDTARMIFAGYRVTAVERHPVVAALLQNGFERACAEGEWGEVFRERLRLFTGDAAEIGPALAAAGESVDVVYLDPMFPERKKRAQVKKEMQLLQRLHGVSPTQPSADEQALLSVARDVAVKRVVVKRPPRAPELAPGVAHRIHGDTVRYDVYLR